MARLSDAKMLEMQAEMERFEKELAGQMSMIAPQMAPQMGPPQTGIVKMIPTAMQDSSGARMIAANTFHQVQSRLVAPPPPPPSFSRSLPLFVPHQVKRGGPAGPGGPGAAIPPPPPFPSTLPTAQAFPGPSRPPHPFAPFESRFHPRPREMGPVLSAPPKPAAGAVFSAPPKIVYAAAPVLNKRVEEEEEKEETPPPKETTTTPAKMSTPQPGSSGLTTTSTTTTTTTKKKEKKEKKFKIRRNLRQAGGETWEDPTLAEWDNDDFRIFVGDIGNEVTDDHLIKAFGKYPSFQKAKVVRDKRTNKSRGFGFVSFKDPQDFIRSMRELNGKYIGNRPMKLRKSNWRDRNLDVVRKKDKEKKKLGLK